MLKWMSLLLVFAQGVMAAESQQTKPRSKLHIMAETEVVPGKRLKGPAAEYQSDGDPNTIELVILNSEDDGPSRVSEDGEVIFQRGLSIAETEMDALLDQAFEIRFKREKAGAE